MKHSHILLILIIGLFSIILDRCQANDDDDDDNDDAQIDYPTLNMSEPYCFEFTWFGPEYNKHTLYNDTCSDYLDNSRAGENIPCIAPIVISDNGNYPNLDLLFDNHKASVLCRKALNQECVTYTYWDSNGIMTNQSHMCARVRASAGNVPFGCHKQKVDGFEVELCICKSNTLGYKDHPCNGSNTNLLNLTCLFLILFVLQLFFVIQS
ncbi:hypothetical protein ABEB36_013930 [Hypothenemus hampei]|uniref:Uncharacterized protein n=1 Tax=Hypothenemus hampei TaxID=57062 RepID=A0ABD1E628_HYPHA